MKKLAVKIGIAIAVLLVSFAVAKIASADGNGGGPWETYPCGE